MHESQVQALQRFVARVAHVPAPGGWAAPAAANVQQAASLEAALGLP